MEENRRNEMLFFLMGMVSALIFAIIVSVAFRPGIKEKELYRFCLIKNIPLEECKIPARPYQHNKGARQ